MGILRALRAISAAHDEVVRLGQSADTTPVSDARADMRCAPPDLHTQWEDLLGEVWRQERFERSHPYTCSVIRQLR